MNFPLCILIMVYWSHIYGITGATTETRDPKDNNVDEVPNMEENFIALVPDQSVNDEMRSNEISINPISTLVFQSEYPETLDGNDYVRNVSKSTPNTPKSLTSQEAEGTWAALGKVHEWSNMSKMRYHTNIPRHRAKKHRHHHHRENRDFHRFMTKKSRQQMDYMDDSENEYKSVRHHGDKWSNFVRLQNEMQHKQDLPPYMKKINRRTKQLRLLMEGTVPPRRLREPHAPHHRRTDDKFPEENIFEEQRPTLKFSSRKFPAIRNSLENSFPGEESAEEVAEGVVKTSTRAGNFIYHRIPSTKPSTGPTFGRVIRKQGLPFVAITDRRAKIHP